MSTHLATAPAHQQLAPGQRRLQRRARLRPHPTQASTNEAATVDVEELPSPTRPDLAAGKRSSVELVKEASEYLLHPLLEELRTEAASINEAAAQLLKFHGSYQQDDRDRRSFQKGKSHQFMMRTRTPSGVVPSQLYCVMDDLSDAYGNGTLRLTTRQAFQLHGIVKGDLKTVFSTVIKSMGSTLAACGDVTRNVTAPPVPYKNDPAYLHAVEWAGHVKDLLAPQGGGYYEVWLDGDKAMTQGAPGEAGMAHDTEADFVRAAREDDARGTNGDAAEPIYGSLYLPRKFKVGVTVPGDNHIDVFTNDLGMVVVTDESDGATLAGFNLLTGGGMGNAHRSEETHPRVADVFGFVPRDRALAAVKAVVCVQRDYGRRDDRKMARLKYTIERLGPEVFRRKVEEYAGFRIEAARPMPPWKFRDYLGWGEQGDGSLYCGVHVANGRVRGSLKRALRTVVERYELEVRLTANQDVILCDVDPAWRSDVAAALEAGGASCDPASLSPIAAAAMACPALPLCGLAITEAERALPDIVVRLDALLARVGLPRERVVVRMTGCPNGCARPYMAELGLVGDGPDTYEVWLGGSPQLTRLAEPFQQKVKAADFETFLEPLFVFFKTRRRETAESGDAAGAGAATETDDGSAAGVTGGESGASVGLESFGDFCARVGFGALRSFQESYVAPPSFALAAPRPRLGLDEATFSAIAAIAERESCTLAEAAARAVAAYNAEKPE